jgi:hypothetical protein
MSLSKYTWNGTWRSTESYEIPFPMATEARTQSILWKGHDSDFVTIPTQPRGITDIILPLGVAQTPAPGDWSSSEHVSPQTQFFSYKFVLFSAWKGSFLKLTELEKQMHKRCRKQAVSHLDKASGPGLCNTVLLQPDLCRERVQMWAHNFPFPLKPTHFFPFVLLMMHRRWAESDMSEWNYQVSIYNQLSFSTATRLDEAFYRSICRGHQGAENKHGLLGRPAFVSLSC